MPRKSWKFRLEDGFHSVDLEHNVWTGKRVIRVDGAVVEESRRSFDLGSEHPIRVAGQPAAVHIRYSGLYAYHYDLVLDGRSFTSGRPVGPMPSWGWGFVAACVAIPIISMGGAVPAALGGGGAAACAAIARNEGQATGTRVALCVGVTLVCWLLFVALLASLATLHPVP